MSVKVMEILKNVMEGQDCRLFGVNSALKMCVLFNTVAISDS